MRVSLLVLCLLLVCLEGSLILNLNQAQHSSYYQWKSQYARSYASGEVEAYRLTLWLQNYNRVQEHNAKYQRRQVSHKVGVNHFSDMAQNQIDSGFFSIFDDSNYTSYCNSTGATDPEEYDPEIPVQFFWGQNISDYMWDQTAYTYSCASAWAIAASTVLSKKYAEPRPIKNQSSLFTFSPQQLIDCTLGSTYHNLGCYGGSVQTSFRFYQMVGAVLNSAYPYVSVGQSCNNSKTITANATGCINLPSNSEYDIRKALTQGPVAAYILGANYWAFTSYTQGIFNDTSYLEDAEPVKHVVTITGYGNITVTDIGVDPVDVKYYRVMNSWGSSWGQSGYIYIAREENSTDGGSNNIQAALSTVIV